MLNNVSYTSALGVSKALAAEGKSLVANPNTPLSLLVSKCIPPIDYQIESEQNVESFGPLLEAVTMNTINSDKSITSNSHGLELDGYINDVSKLVTTHIGFAKNVVKPLVVEYAESLKTYLDTHKTPGPSSKFQVVSLKTPELLEDDSFLDNLKYYKDKSVLIPDASKSLTLDNKSLEEILTLCSTGRDRTDELVKAWVSRLGIEFLTTVWTCFFTKQQPVGKYVSYDTLKYTNVYETADYALAIYLLANKIYDDVQTSVDNLDLYQAKVVQLRDYAGALLVSCINKIALFKTNKTLVVEANPVNYTIKVNAAVYQDWLTTGGTVEALLGLLISNSSVSSVALIDQKVKDYTNAWNSYVMFHETNEANKIFDYFKDYLIVCLDQSLNTLTESEQEMFAKNSMFISNIKKLAIKEIDSLRNSDIDNIFEVSLKIVAKCRFYYTSAYGILNDINDIGKKNPNVDVREAALIAAINYISDYLAYQISYSNG